MIVQAAEMVMKEIEIQGVIARLGNPTKPFLRVDSVVGDFPPFFDDIIAGTTSLQLSK